MTDQISKNSQGKSSSLGIVLVVVGILLLLNTLGIVPWEIWRFIVSLWPLILILLGLQLLSGKPIVKDFILMVGGFVLVFIVLFTLLYWLLPDFRELAMEYVPSTYLQYLDIAK